MSNEQAGGKQAGSNRVAGNLLVCGQIPLYFVRLFSVFSGQNQRRTEP